MREILFRGKTTKKDDNKAFNNIWVEGDLVHAGISGIYIHPQANTFVVDNELARLVVMHEVIPESIGQFTGLFDKYQKKIFEGDIIQLGEDEDYNWGFNIGVVKFGEGTFDSGIYRYTGFFYEDKNGNIDHNALYNLGEDWEKCKVIGNIHDNPELL